MAEALGGWANPSSVHAEGRAARALLEEARHRILKGLGAWSGARLVFTSGATEALALALSRTRADHVLVGATEHDAVLSAAPDAPRIAVDRSGPIGRASCRGRVCQYVSISVVAGTLKKKKLT